MIAQATGELGGVDILVNNAGIQHTAPVPDFPTERWDAIIAINLSAIDERCFSADPGRLVPDRLIPTATRRPRWRVARVERLEQAAPRRLGFGPKRRSEALRQAPD